MGVFGLKSLVERQEKGGRVLGAHVDLRLPASPAHSSAASAKSLHSAFADLSLESHAPLLPEAPPITVGGRSFARGLVVDYSSLEFELARAAEAEGQGADVYGTNYAAFGARLLAWVNTFRSLGFRLVFVADPAAGVDVDWETKADTWLQRGLQRHEESTAYYTLLASGAGAMAARPSPTPPTSSTAFSRALLEPFDDVHWAICLGESDPALCQLCDKLNFLAVVSNDSDFFVIKGARYIPIYRLQPNGPAPCATLYQQELLCARWGLTYDALVLFAALAGTDITKKPLLASPVPAALGVARPARGGVGGIIGVNSHSLFNLFCPREDVPSGPHGPPEAALRAAAHPTLVSAVAAAQRFYAGETVAPAALARLVRAASTPTVFDGLSSADAPLPEAEQLVVDGLWPSRALGVIQNGVSWCGKEVVLEGVQQRVGCTALVAEQRAVRARWYHLLGRCAPVLEVWQDMSVPLIQQRCEVMPLATDAAGVALPAFPAWVFLPLSQRRELVVRALTVPLPTAVAESPDANAAWFTIVWLLYTARVVFPTCNLRSGELVAVACMLASLQEGGVYQPPPCQVKLRVLAVREMLTKVLGLVRDIFSTLLVPLPSPALCLDGALLEHFHDLAKSLFPGSLNKGGATAAGRRLLFAANRGEAVELYCTVYAPIVEMIMETYLTQPVRSHPQLPLTMGATNTAQTTAPKKKKSRSKKRGGKAH